MEIEFIFANSAEFGESNFCDTPKRFDAIYMTFSSGQIRLCSDRLDGVYSRLK